MKAITTTQLGTVIEEIMHDKEELAKLRKEIFSGVAESDVLSELERRIGVKWVLKKEPPFKLKESIDIPAIANARYFRGIGVDGQKSKGMSGQMLLMVWAIVVIVFAMLTLTVRILPLPIYYGLGIVTTVVCLYIYSRRQKQARNELKRAVYGSDKVDADREK